MHPHLPGDRGVALASGCCQHDLGPQPVAVLAAHRPGADCQDGLFLTGQDNLVQALHRHLIFVPHLPARRQQDTP
jgi:hypothetical protein